MSIHISHMSDNQPPPQTLDQHEGSSQTQPTTNACHTPKPGSSAAVAQNTDNGGIPARIHIKDVNKYKGPVSYNGGPWYRPILPPLPYPLARPPAPLSAKDEEIRKAADEYLVWQQGMMARVASSQKEAQEEAAGARLAKPKRRKPKSVRGESVHDNETAARVDETEGVMRKGAEGSLTLMQRTPGESGDRPSGEALQKREIARAQQETTQYPRPDAVHFSGLAMYPGAEFRSVGNGWYIRDASRTGEWVVVPHKRTQ